ncbi:MAG: BON domain-containing protein [Parachlamydiaceae bacterium]
MKKIFTLIAFGSFSVLSAGEYNYAYENGSNDCPSCYYNNRGYYQNQPNQSYYYQPNQYGDSRGYYQRDDRNYLRNEQYDNQQHMPRYQDYDQNRHYYQQRGSYRDQQRYYDNAPDYRNQQRYYDNAPDYRNQQRDDENHRTMEKGNDQKSMSDIEIRKKIEEKMSAGWFSKGFHNLSFDVNHGNVDLRGSVDTLENKDKVEETVKKIDGVRNVNNHITIVKENPDLYSESRLQDSEKKYPQDLAINPEDREINAKIRDKIGGWFSGDNEALVIKTSNGIVVISGPVDKIEEIQKIIDRIKSVDGVKSVKNQLEIKTK